MGCEGYENVRFLNADRLHAGLIASSLDQAAPTQDEAALCQNEAAKGTLFPGSKSHLGCVALQVAGCLVLVQSACVGNCSY